MSRTRHKICTRGVLASRRLAGQLGERKLNLDAQIDRIDLSVFTVPTESPESDGTLQWSQTTMVLVELSAAGKRGLGYTYGQSSIAVLIRKKLAPLIEGADAMDVRASWEKMTGSIRNNGRPGICSMAISAVDNALWDLKARLLDLPLVKLLGAVRESIPAYGSGGFTSYTVEQLQKHLGEWVEAGISRVKMKVGREPRQDPERVRAARQAIGPETELFVDANGAYDVKQALAMAECFREAGVSWFEEPVEAENFSGQRFIRERLPAGMEVANGEYGYNQPYFRELLLGGAADVMQADATRCAGITGFMEAGMLAGAFAVPFSSHTAPSLHMHPCCALPGARHCEYFRDHARIEQMFFAGAAQPVQGALKPDLSAPGLGLEFKRSDAKKFAE